MREILGEPGRTRGRYLAGDVDDLVEDVIDTQIWVSIDAVGAYYCGFRVAMLGGEGTPRQCAAMNTHQRFSCEERGMDNTYGWSKVPLSEPKIESRRPGRVSFARTYH